jgi:2-C-methyl-D-erythritol 4-phosphate cytidylyltransferase
MKNIAIILAGGTGSRLGYDIPKQFFKVAGKTVIEHTVEVFETHAAIDEIAIVSHAAYTTEIENMILANGWRKVKKILHGGSERYESSLSAINAYADFPDCNLIFHDAVRPMLSHRIIDDVMTALGKYNAIDVAVPATDTIIQVDEKGECIANIPDRRFLRRGQTPQAFNLKTISKAYEIALKDPHFVSSDDCGTVIKYLPEEPVFVVVGEESNMKLTYKEDSYLLDKLFQLRSFSLQNDVDFHYLKDKIIVVFGGNSGIGQEISKTAEKFGAKAFPFSRSSTGTDISDRESVKKALAKVFAQTGKIDFVVNAAAILVKEPLVAMQEDTIDRLIATNYNGMVNVSIESYEYLKQSQGQLLLYTSSSYTRGRAFYSLYSSTKAAVVNFAQALAQEWETVNIRVNVVNPERTKTPMRTKNFGNEPDDTLLKAETVAEVSLKTLLSDFTGQVIDVKRK